MDVEVIKEEVGGLADDHGGEELTTNPGATTGGNRGLNEGNLDLGVLGELVSSRETYTSRNSVRKQFQNLTRSKINKRNKYGRVPCVMDHRIKGLGCTAIHSFTSFALKVASRFRYLCITHQRDQHQQ